MSVVPRGYAESAAEPVAQARFRRNQAASGAHRVLVVLALVGSVHALFVLGVEGWRFVQERRAVVHLQQQVTELRSEAKGLNQVVDHAGDQTYREDLARRQGFMYPDELRAVTQKPAAAPPQGQAGQAPASGASPSVSGGH